MKRGILTTIAVLAVLASLTACGKKNYGTGEITVTADRYELSLYEDDSTEIIYTVTTPPECVAVYLRQVYTPSNYADSLAAMGVETVAEADKIDPEVCHHPLNERAFRRGDAGVRIEERDGVSVWTLPCDFGFNGVDGVQVAAEIPWQDMSYRLYAMADVHVRYPEVDIAADYQNAILAYLRYNNEDNKPFYFVCDMPEGSSRSGTGPLTYYEYAMWNGWDERSAARENVWSLISRVGTLIYNNVAFDGQQTDAWQLFAQYTDLTEDYREIKMTGMLVPDGRVLGCMFLRDEDHISCREGGGGIRVSDSARAAAAYLGGYELSEQRYPAAAWLLAQGREVLAAILTGDMTDHEKEKAIHDWLREKGLTCALTPEVEALPVSEQDYYIKTAYGVMQGIGGDCTGWSDVYYMLCNMAGLKCSKVPACRVEEGEDLPCREAGLQPNHQLNAVFLDGDWYYCDMFWDGAGSGYESPPYAYFNLTSGEAEQYYRFAPAEQGGAPESDAVRYAVDDETGALLHG